MATSAGAKTLRRPLFYWLQARFTYGAEGEDESEVRTAALVEGGSAYVHYPALIEADRLHDEGIYGSGITVAVLDSGFMLQPELNRGIYDQTRKLKLYQAVVAHVKTLTTGNSFVSYSTEEDVGAVV